MQLATGKWLGGLALLGMLSGCAQNVQDDGIEIHRDAIREVALTYGAQSGLSFQSKAISDSLEAYGKELDTIYNFNALMMHGHVLPPVIEESILSYNLANAKEVRMANKEIKIVKHARFVTTAPNWREYLELHYDKPKVPSLAILPHDNDEEKVWQKAVTQGWREGVAQANSNFTMALRHLNRDFIGMSTYYMLYTQNMVSAPVTANTDLGITGDDNAMRIGDTILRITAPSMLKTQEPNKWQPSIEH